MNDNLSPNDYWFTHMNDADPEEAVRMGCLSAGGYVLIVILLLIFCSIFDGCKTANVPTGNKDSVRTETRTEVAYVTDTIYVSIPYEKESVITKDSVSHLENEYSFSEARISVDGTLFHLLATKPQYKPIEFQKPIITKDSVMIETKWRTKTIEVERKKTWWEQTKSYGFYALVLILLIRYRKKIWNMITSLKV